MTKKKKVSNVTKKEYFTINELPSIDYHFSKDNPKNDGSKTIRVFVSAESSDYAYNLFKKVLKKTKEQEEK